MNQKSTIPILILAAGSSSRLGSPKQLLKLNGKTLLQKAIGTALEVSEFVGVTLGANQEKIKPTIADLPVQFIFNEKWSEGLSASIRVGIDFLQNLFADKAGNKIESKAVIIMLCDQPYVDVFLLKKIIQTYEQSGKPIVACKYDNQPAVPALFDISFFEKLKTIKGDRGAKPLIMNHLEETEFILFEKGKIDVDTKEDYKRLKSKD